MTVDEPDGSARLTLPGPADGASLLSRTAAAVAQALVAGAGTRLKACEAVTCPWAYHDRSPAGRGRWCSMQVCGARAQMRRYRAKWSTRQLPGWFTGRVTARWCRMHQDAGSAD